MQCAVVSYSPFINLHCALVVFVYGSLGQFRRYQEKEEYNSRRFVDSSKGSAPTGIVLRR